MNRTFSLPLNDSDRSYLKMNAVRQGKSPNAADDVLVAIWSGLDPAPVAAASLDAETIEGIRRDAIAAAVAAVIAADPEVVKDPEAVTALITEAVAEAPAPAEEAIQAAADAVAVIVAAATGEKVTPEIKEELAVAVAAPADPVLDFIEARLEIAETKVDTLLGK